MFSRPVHVYHDIYETFCGMHVQVKYEHAAISSIEDVLILLMSKQDKQGK
jgi:hypothetical protein